MKSNTPSYTEQHHATLHYNRLWSNTLLNTPRIKYDKKHHTLFSTSIPAICTHRTSPMQRYSTSVGHNSTSHEHKICQLHSMVHAMSQGKHTGVSKVTSEAQPDNRRVRNPVFCYFLEKLPQESFNTSTSGGSHWEAVRFVGAQQPTAKHTLERDNCMLTAALRIARRAIIFTEADSTSWHKQRTRNHFKFMTMTRDKSLKHSTKKGNQ